MILAAQWSRYFRRNGVVKLQVLRYYSQRWGVCSLFTFNRLLNTRRHLRYVAQPVSVPNLLPRKIPRITLCGHNTTTQEEMQ